MGWAASHVNRPGQPAAAESALSCLFGLLDNFESRSWKGWWLNSLFFLTSMRCCLKPQCCAGLKPQACCATYSHPVPSSSPHCVPGDAPAQLPSSPGPCFASSRCQRRKQSSGNASPEGSQPHSPDLAQGEGLLPPPGHGLGSRQPTSNTAQVAPASPCSQPRLGKEQGSRTAAAQHSPYQLNTYPLGTGAGNRTG